MPPIPEGFRKIERLSPFNALVGPLYERRDGDAVSIGLLIDDKPIVRASAIFAREGRSGDQSTE